MNYEQYFSTNARGMKASEIRELLKLTRKPGVISFAGGLPAPDLFPVEEIREITNEIMEKEGRLAVQYGPTEGDMGLREELLKVLKDDGINISVDQLFIITSSQQGLDLVAKIFCDPGDVIMCGRPTYIGAIQAFNSYQAKMCGVPLDDKGMNTVVLEREIRRNIAQGKKPKFIYVIPDFQNPSGITMDLERRKELIEIAERHDLIIIEDSPYRQLRFEGKAEPPLLSLSKDRVISLYTFSKILIPGFRLGWMAGPQQLIQKAIIAKQAVDLCAPPFNQAIIAEFLRRDRLKPQIKRIVAAYKEKRDFMIEMFEKYMPKLDGLKWTTPEGGLFLWLTFPKYMDANEMFLEAVKRKVAYVVGSAFDPDGAIKNTCRINFSYPTKEQIEEGIKRLACVVEDWEAQKGVDSPIAP